MKEMRDFFNARVDRFKVEDEFSDLRDQFVEKLNLKEGSTIVDLGCGEGIMLKNLLKTNPKTVIEVDVSTDMICENIESHKEIECVSFVCGDFLNICLKEVDAVMIYNAYPHFLDKKKLSKHLASCLNEHGIVMIAHSKSKEMLNNHHKGQDDHLKVSTMLKTPLEEYEAFKEEFELEEYYDDSYYFIKLTKR